ncbi:hypothetical protein ACFLRC_02905 [Candidatus Altiarchaeota archaeon]
MIDEKVFSDIKEGFESFDQRLDQVIKKSRDVIKLSKQVIYSVNRRDVKKAGEFFDSMEKGKLEMDSLVEGMPRLRYGGSYKVVCQEYTEAACYLAFVKGGNIPSPSDLKVDNEEYLLGICDLSGELVRKAVNDAINKDYKEVLKARKFLEGIYGQFLELAPTGELRKKIDSVRWNLNKIEDLVYEANIKGFLE